jgi:hypothetical protein
MMYTFLTKSANQVSTIIEQQKSKKTKAYKNPILLKKNSIKFDKDAMSNTYYISFEYTAIKDFDIRIYFNAEHNDNEIIPSKEFKNC